jgi:hypothetical protein
MGHSWGGGLSGGISHVGSKFLIAMDRHCFQAFPANLHVSTQHRCDTGFQTPIMPPMDEKIVSQLEDSNNLNPTNPSSTIHEVSAVKLKGRPSLLLWILVSQFLGLAWLAPIIALLILNFQGYIAGASVGCGVRKCNDNPFSINNVTRTSQQLDTDDHDILGVLQLVAKALEIWFIFLAGCLVYDLTMLLARRGDGLPMRYLTMPDEFSELRRFLDRSFWSSVNPFNSQIQNSVLNSSQPRTQKLILVSFILFIAAISIICNLMGPATAVLLLPTLVWRAVPIPQTQVFAGIASAEPPAGAEIVSAELPAGISACNASSLAAGQYSCTESLIGNSVDSMLSFTAEGEIARLDYISSLVVPFNILYFQDILVPNRQTLTIVSADFVESIDAGGFSNYSEAVPAIALWTAQKAQSENISLSIYNALRNAQQVIRLRQGPGFLLQAQCYEDVSVIEISDDKVVRCYNIPNPDDVEVFPYPITTGTTLGSPASTMCIRVGSAWVGHNAHSTFSIGISSTDSIAVDVYSTDRAIYLTSTTYHCSANKVTTGAVPCDWDALFSAEPTPDIRNATVNPSVTEYSLSGKPTYWCRSFAFLRLLTYVLDTSPTSNPLSVVTFEDNGPLTSVDEPVFVHPDWTLAAWSVDKGQTVPSNRAGALAVVNAYLSGFLNEFYLFYAIVTAQSLSLIGYSMKEIDAMGSPPTPTTPIFQVNLLVHVWSYGVESRTSKLGVVVAIIGCLIVLVKSVVGVWARAVGRDMLDFVTTALEQKPPGIFEGLDAKEAGRVRFWMDNEKKARFKFEHKSK